MNKKKTPTRAQIKKNYEKAKMEMLQSMHQDLCDIFFSDLVEGEIFFSGGDGTTERNCAIVDWGINQDTGKIYIVIKSDLDRSSGDDD